jgi:hypothetical protein
MKFFSKNDKNMEGKRDNMEGKCDETNNLTFLHVTKTINTPLTFLQCCTIWKENVMRETTYMYMVCLVGEKKKERRHKNTKINTCTWIN